MRERQAHDRSRVFPILEPVINFRAGGVARENRARRGGGRTLWPVHYRGRQRSMARFLPQPAGLGPVFLTSASLLTPGTEKNCLPAPPAGKLITGSGAGAENQKATGARSQELGGSLWTRRHSPH